MTAREIAKGVAGEQRLIAVQDAGRQRRERHNAMQLVGLAETD
ncbi:hypothetical protein [Streptomyces agglomeratus]|nr:hypothetical protein [Streptomyces agglomeratus]